MRSVRFEKLRPGELLAEKQRRSIVYLPIGPLEWHGPAMPFGTDPETAGEVARRAAAITGGVVLPPLHIGTERERSEQLLADAGIEDTKQYIVGMDVPGNTVPSLYWPEEVFGLVVREYIRLLVQQGYRLIILLNGHGATNQRYMLDKLAVEFSATTAARVINVMGVAHYDENDEDMGHATRLETAMQMYLGADNVKLDELPPKGVKLKSADWGIMDGYTFDGNPPADKCVVFDPRDATPEMGRKYVEASAAYVAGVVNEAYEAL